MRAKRPTASVRKALGAFLMIVLFTCRRQESPSEHLLALAPRSERPIDDLHGPLHRGLVHHQRRGQAHGIVTGGEDQQAAFPTGRHHVSDFPVAASYR